VSSTILRSPSARFYAAALLVIGTCATLVHTSLFARNPDVAAWGVTFDLTITLPLLYWFLVVRPGHARALTIAPLFLIGSLIAAFVVPRGEQQFLHQLGTFAGSAVELVLIGALVRRIAALRRENFAVDDPYARIATAAHAIAGGRVGDVIASETAMFYYALFCWRKQPRETPSQTLTFHQRSGWGTIVVCILVMIVAEGIGMHFLLGRWSAKAAWGWTALDLWAMVWFVGDYHALRLRRSTFDGDALALRYGLRWSATIPLAEIASVEAIRGESDWKRRGVLKVAMLDEPRWLVTLKTPMVANGLAGIRKTIDALALLPDDDDAINALRIATSSDLQSAALP
jgi:hypothetical protein